MLPVISQSYQSRLQTVYHSHSVELGDTFVDLFCGRLNRPHYRSCSSVRLSHTNSTLENEKVRKETKLVRIFPLARVTGWKGQYSVYLSLTAPRAASRSTAHQALRCKWGLSVEIKHEQVLDERVSANDRLPLPTSLLIYCTAAGTGACLAGACRRRCV